MGHDSATSAMLAVPGAQIYYETRGAGPALLIIPGGPQDAGVFAELARTLADRYTVITFDPRGNSRSTFDGQPQDCVLDVHGDDAARLIQALGRGPAFVFGTSGGAQIALNLTARHPDLVRTVVAHEPPTMMLLEDPSEALASDEALYDTYRRDGVEAAMAQFFAANGLGEGDLHGPEAGESDPPPFQMSQEDVETFARVSGNFEYWLAHGLLPLSRYLPEVDTLRAGVSRVVVGIGVESEGQPIHAMSVALATHLNVDTVPFPGDHMGFGPNATEFAETLHEVYAAAMAW